MTRRFGGDIISGEVKKVKRKLFIILIILALILLVAVPGAGAIRKAENNKKSETSGEIFRIPLRKLSYINDEDGAVLSFSVGGISGSICGKKYASLSTDSEGFVILTPCAEPAKGENYIRGEKNCLYFSFPVSEVPCKSFEKLVRVNFTDLEGQFSVDPQGYIDIYAEKAYIEARVSDGGVTVLSVYIGGEKAEDYINSLNEKFDSYLDRFTVIEN